MAYVNVPKDLRRIRTKIAFGLTKRQLILFGVAVLLGLPVFFYTKNSLGTSIASFIMILIMLPCFIFAMYERNGQPLEVYLKHMIQAKFIRPQIRIYQNKIKHSEYERKNSNKKDVKNNVQKTK